MPNVSKRVHPVQTSLPTYSDVYITFFMAVKQYVHLGAVLISRLMSVSKNNHKPGDGGKVVIMFLLEKKHKQKVQGMVMVCAVLGIVWTENSSPNYFCGSAVLHCTILPI